MNAQERQQFLDHWKAVRAKGIVRYVVITAISWGTFSAVFLRAIMVLLEQGFSPTSLLSAFNSREFLIYWGVFLIGGLAYGVTMWFYFNRRYRKLQPEQEPQAKPSESH